MPGTSPAPSASPFAFPAPHPGGHGTASALGAELGRPWRVRAAGASGRGRPWRVPVLSLPPLFSPRREGSSGSLGRARPRGSMAELTREAGGGAPARLGGGATPCIGGGGPCPRA
jgi:hypothetical protein